MPRAILIGPPGSGKSTVGKSLAKRLKCDFVDTDAVIEADSGKKISEIFIEDGEPFFRKLEESAVSSCIQHVNSTDSFCLQRRIHQVLPAIESKKSKARITSSLESASCSKLSIHEHRL